MLSIALPVAALHFVTGPQYKGPFPHFVNGFLLDILIPFAFYFLLSVNIPKFKFKLLGGIAIFLAACGAEIFQYFGITVLGSTFDPWDFLMYGLGVAAAVIFDWLFISRVILRDIG